MREPRPRVVLIEGADCTGKSTVARVVHKIIKHGPGPGVMPAPRHFDVPPGTGNTLSFFLNQLEEWKQTSWGGFVLDRCHLSNLAYNGRLGGGVLDATGWSVIDNWFRQARALLIMMVDEPQAIWERVQRDRDPRTRHLTPDQWGGIQNRFNLGFHGSLIPYKGSYQLPQLVEDGKPTENLITVLTRWLADEE